MAKECYSRLKGILEKIENYNYEIIFINDGSKDKTLPILMEIAEKDKNVKVISFARNFGHQCAVTAGLQYVTGDAIVIIDADLQYYFFFFFFYITIPSSQSFNISGISSGGSCKSASIITIASPVTY